MRSVTGALFTAAVLSLSLPALAADDCPAGKGSVAAIKKTATALQEDRRALCARAGKSPLAEAQLEQLKGCLATHVEPCGSKKTPELLALVQGQLTPLMTPATFCDESAWVAAYATARKDYEENKATLSKATQEHLGLISTQLTRLQTCVHKLARP